VSIGPAEIIIVLIIALLVFGPKRLPQMGKSLGRGVREFKKAAETAKTELGLGEVTDGINDIKSTFTDPVKEVTGTFTDLKKSVDVKAAIEAPVAGAAAVAAGASETAAAPDVPALAGLSKPKAVPARPPGAVDAGPETPDVTPATVFADVTPPPAPEAPPAEAPPETPLETTPAEAPVAGAPASSPES